LKLQINAPARADIQYALEFIAQDNPRAATATAERIFQSLQSLADLPSRGRPGRVAGTRELPIPGSSYIAIYEVVEQAVIVTRVLHNRQNWPPA
jgi:addiction module RelE/StbE family toxin